MVNELPKDSFAHYNLRSTSRLTPTMSNMKTVCVIHQSMTLILNLLKL
jgi:hypothetical protein